MINNIKVKLICKPFGYKCSAYFKNNFMCILLQCIFMCGQKKSNWRTRNKERKWEKRRLKIGKTNLLVSMQCMLLLKCLFINAQEKPSTIIFTSVISIYFRSSHPKFWYFFRFTWYNSQSTYIQYIWYIILKYI